MRSIVRVGIASAAATGMLAAGGLTTSASAQPVNIGNLVNVNISNVLNNNDVDVNVLVPVNAAANICNVDVDVLVAAIGAPGPQTFGDCDARSGQDVTVTG